MERNSFLKMKKMRAQRMPWAGLPLIFKEPNVNGSGNPPMYD